MKQNKKDHTDMLRLNAAAELLGISVPTLWRLDKDDPTFPKKIKLTARCVGYRKQELVEWLKSKQ